MKNENLEEKNIGDLLLLKDCTLIQKAKESYIKKEDLINLINSLSFTEVKSLRLCVITDYGIKYNDDNDPYVKTFGYDIEID